MASWRRNNGEMASQRNQWHIGNGAEMANQWRKAYQ